MFEKISRDRGLMIFIDHLTASVYSLVNDFLKTLNYSVMVTPVMRLMYGKPRKFLIFSIITHCL